MSNFQKVLDVLREGKTDIRYFVRTYTDKDKFDDSFYAKNDAEAIKKVEEVGKKMVKKIGSHEVTLSKLKDPNANSGETVEIKDFRFKK